MEKNVLHKIEELQQFLSSAYKDDFNKITRDLIIVQNRLYAQLESLTWLQRRLSIKGHLPALRGWAMSPDVLLRLHTYIMDAQPKLVVELGCGASTLVIADALRQNGFGQLVSLEHSSFYAEQTQSLLDLEDLKPWVSIFVGELEDWEGEHLNLDADQPPRWYPREMLREVGEVELLVVDGPPENTCKYARYPALPAFFGHLSSKAEVWMDDTIRPDEQEICQRWADLYGFRLEFFPLEKGLGVLSRL